MKMLIVIQETYLLQKNGRIPEHRREINIFISEWNFWEKSTKHRSGKRPGNTDMLLNTIKAVFDTKGF